MKFALACAFFLCAAAVFAGRFFVDGNENYFDVSDAGNVPFFVCGDEDSHVVINTFATKEGVTASRWFYDSLYRVVKKEFYKISDNINECVLSSAILYKYEAENDAPFFSRHEFFDKNMAIDCFYTTSGKIKRRVDLHFDNSKHEITDSETVWKYDKKGRIEELTETTAHPNVVKKDVYDYNGSGSKPDCVRYENGEIRMKLIYENHNSYVQTSFFDNGYAVSALFKDGIKVQERYLLNGQEVRRNDYEETQ